MIGEHEIGFLTGALVDVGNEPGTLLLRLVAKGGVAVLLVVVNQVVAPGPQEFLHHAASLSMPIDTLGGEGGIALLLRHPFGKPQGGQAHAPHVTGHARPGHGFIPLIARRADDSCRTGNETHHVFHRAFRGRIELFEIGFVTSALP